MFPNPQDALPLPPRPNLEQYKKLAKELVRATKSTAPDAVRNCSTNWVKGLVERSGLEITTQLPVRTDGWIRDVANFAQAKLSDGTRLSDAQFVIARSHGFPSWPKFVRHIHNATDTASLEAQFEAAADAIITGDISTLFRLLRANPKLVHLRSSHEHGATLLHYVSANGVEGYRQKTPKNIVEIADLLLRVAADVNAGADVYNGNCTALGLAATSVHPQQAGVQQSLMQLLLEHGADLRDSADTGATALHWAAGAGNLDLVKLLIHRGAPLEVINRWGGTVLEHAGHGFQHGPANVNFVPTFEILLAAGAKIRGSWLKWLEGVNSRSSEEKARVTCVSRPYRATACRR